MATKLHVEPLTCAIGAELSGVDLGAASRDAGLFAEDEVPVVDSVLDAIRGVGAPDAVLNVELKVPGAARALVPLSAGREGVERFRRTDGIDLATRDGANDHGYGLVNAGDLDGNGTVDVITCSPEPPPAPAPAGDGKVKPPEVVKPTTAGDPRQP